MRIGVICCFVFVLTSAPLAELRAETSDEMTLCRFGEEGGMANGKGARDSEMDRRIAAAVQQRDFKEALYLLEEGYDPGYSLRQEPWLKRVLNDVELLDGAKHNDVEKIRHALGEGADVEVARPVGSTWTPLMIASRCGYIESARVLVDYGASVNAMGAGALFTATRGDHIDILRFLLERGADPNLRVKRNGVGVTPLMVAQSAEAVCVLLQFGAQPNAIDVENNMTALVGALDNPMVFKALVAGGADVGQEFAGGVSLKTVVDSVENAEVKGIIRNFRNYLNKGGCEGKGGRKGGRGVQ